MSITIKKRCPNGTRRNKKTQKCEPKNVTKYSAIEQKSPLRKKRCPNGYRRHPKTKRCTIMSGPNKGKTIDTPL